ncbi:MAG TPA: DUF3291 domain-containing protein [Cyclobacteriaceae bacterium]
MSNWHLAQINIGRIAGVDMNDPVMSDFVAQLDEVNTLAENSEGFVWRFKEENNNATSLHPYDDERIIINMSVWETVEHLEAFTYKGRHVEVLKKRRSWFESMGKPISVLWWIPAGHLPTVDEAKERLKHLQDNGPSAYAFDFKTRIEKPAV